MRRFLPPIIAGLALISAACSDATAPTRSVNDSDLSVITGASADGRKTAGPPRQVFEQTFTIPAAGTTEPIRVGDFWLTFPANVVCKPGSGYGKNFWNKPCQTLTTDVRVTATYWWENGQALIEFSPDMRFDPSKFVYIWTFRPALIGLSSLPAGYQLELWTRGDRGRVRLDETEQTTFDPATGQLQRRIKHFSGVSASSGMPCDDTVGDPDCVPDDGSGTRP